MVMGLYSAMLLAVLVVGAPWWLVRMATSGRYRAGLPGRLGRVPAELRERCAGKPVIWLHAVSVGEVMAATRLVEELREEMPGWVIAVSTTTETGQSLARQRLGAESPVFYLPLDFAVVVRRYLKVVGPRLLVLMESELWPNLLQECRRAGVPVAVVNARVSDRSFPRYMRLKRLWQPLLAMVEVFLAQSEETAERLVTMGVPADRVRTLGNLKFDVREREMSPLVGMVRDRLPAKAVVVVCGSTLEGEERTLLEAWPEVVAAEPTAVMVLAPRHPERFDGVAALVASWRLTVVRASEFRERPVALERGGVLVLDTIGDLATMYSLGRVAFVGGSLVAGGGHNPLEAAQFGVPVVMGGSYENFREIVERMRAEDAVRVVRHEALGDVLVEVLGNRKDARGMGERGRAVFEAQAGATARMVKALRELVRVGENDV